MFDHSSPIYAIPGLGTNSRIFEPLQEQLPLRPLEWLPPASGESLRSYAARMAIAIDHPNPWLLGVSFGGIVAQEIARMRPIQGLILVSSLKAQDRRPAYIRWSRQFPLYRLTRGTWRIKTLPLYAPRFGVRKAAEIRTLKEIFKSFDDEYRMWALHQMAHWDGHPISRPYLHLHGSKDRVLPIQGLQQVTRIEGGTHFMIYQQPEAIAKEFQRWLERKRIGVGS